MNESENNANISLSITDEELEEAKLKYVNDNLEHVIDRIREAFPPEKYERLVNYAAKLFIEGSLIDKERYDFFNAMLSMEFAIANEDKGMQEQIGRNFKNNLLFREVLHIKSHENKIYHKFPNFKRHAEDSSYEKLVTIDWGIEPAKFRSAEAAAKHYERWLQVKHKKEYTQRTIAGWIRKYAKNNGIKFR